MKKFNFIFIALAIVFLTSCEPSKMSDAVIVEQINETDDSECEGCHKYEVKLKTYYGETYYLTNYRHAVGDTLFSKSEFRDLRLKAIESRNREIDSLKKLNSNLSKKNEELEVYNQLLIGIVKSRTLEKEQK